MRRKTVSLHPEIDKMLRSIQGKLINDSESSYWSFSKIVNIVLLQGLLGRKEINVDHMRAITDFLHQNNLAITDELSEFISDTANGVVYSTSRN